MAFSYHDLENSRNINMNMEVKIIFLVLIDFGLPVEVLFSIFILTSFSLYHLAIYIKNNTAIPATNVNQMAPNCPRGINTNAVMAGARAFPAFPPTWKILCAKPLRGPAAKYATRELSG